MKCQREALKTQTPTPPPPPKSHRCSSQFSQLILPQYVAAIIRLTGSRLLAGFLPLTLNLQQLYIHNIFCESSLPFPIDSSRSFSAKRSVDLIRSIVVSSRFSYDPRVFIAFMHHVRVVFDTPTSTIYRSVYVYCMFDRFLGYLTHWAVKTIAWMERERYMKLRQCTYICYGSYADCIRCSGIGSIMKKKNCDSIQRSVIILIYF